LAKSFGHGEIVKGPGGWTGRLTAAPLVWILWTTCALSQTTTATLQGTVRDPTQAVLPGASVAIRNTDTGYVRSTTTNERGDYFLAYIPVGMYTLTVEHEGFNKQIREDLHFLVGQQATVDVVLSVATLATELIVHGEASQVETTKSVIDKVIHREQIDDLPLENREASSLALLAPGVVPTGNSEEPAFSGGQPRGSGETLIDGVSNEGIMVNFVRSNAPPDAIQEFQVLTNQYQAEFGNASGLILNTITRSGTNELHGRAYYFHRDERLDARNAFATEKAAFKQKQAGGWLGGPIIRDRTHFFTSYEGTRNVSIATVISPLDPGDFPQPFDNNQLLVKVDHQLTPKNQLVGRFSLDRPFLHNATVGGYVLNEMGLDELIRDRAYVGALTTVPSSQMLNELRVQFSDTFVKFDVKHPEVYTVYRPSSFSGKWSNQPQGFTERRFQMVDNLSYQRASHELKFGIEFNRIQDQGFLYLANPGVFLFGTDAPFDPNNPATYPLTFVRNLGDVTYRYLSIDCSGFLQDAWRVSRGLTFNLGLRYDAWEITPGLDLQRVNLAPRLAFAWDPWHSGKTSIRGGWGVFYNNVLVNVALTTDFIARQRSITIFHPGYPDPFSGGKIDDTPVNTFIHQPHQPLPKAYHTTIGIQRELSKDFIISADYVNSRGRKLIRTIQTNPVTPPDFTRPDPTKGSVGLLESTGFSDYHGLLVSVEKRVGKRARVGAAYTWSAYKSTNDFEFTFDQDDFNKNGSYGYGLNDQRHRAVINGSWQLRWGFQICGVLTGNTGIPFDIVTGNDNNRNGIPNDRPDLAPGARPDTDDMRQRSSFLDPGDRAGNLPRNAGRAYPAWQLDMRLAKRFRFDRIQFELMIEAFNLTNHVNFLPPDGNLQSPFFGTPTQAGPARQVQLAVRFEF
jgi:hypothetical protein